MDESNRSYPLKALGPDNMYVIFYHKWWNITGKSIFNIIRTFFNYGVILKIVNNTHIILIPKKDNPTEVKYL